MAHYTVLIVRYNDICKVLPAHRYVESGDTITFRAIKTSATILAPREDLFESKESRNEIREGGEVRLTLATRGAPLPVGGAW